MKYCKDTTQEHAICLQYPDELEVLNHIFQAEGYSTPLFEDVIAINLDKIEVKRCAGTTGRKPTMDFAMGTSLCGKRKQILLVELKFRVKNPANITRTELDDKFRHSVELLSYQPPIADCKIIIFNDKQLAVARSYMARLYAKSPKANIIVYSAKEFKENYF